jgi:S1-C subfamily serine protease
VGSVVYAIGSPLGQELAGTLTKGVISGSRTTGGASYLQSDVAVNPGNSGGPLLDDTANVIGITAQKIAGAEGLAFFIPIKDAMDKLNIKFDDATAP